VLLLVTLVWHDWIEVVLADHRHGTGTSTTEEPPRTARDPVAGRARTYARADEQWNVKSRMFTAPKAHHVRTIAMTERAMRRLLSLPRESEFTFTTLRGSHYRPSSRAHHWNRVRAAAGLGNVELYTVTRHYFGWYAFNVLGLPDHVIALHLGHRDGGKLVRMLYGHPDARIARERVREAYRQAPPAPTPLVRVTA